MLAGEWAILEPGNRCIVMAVDKYLSATITSSDTFIFNLPDLNLPPIEVIYKNGYQFPTKTLTQEQTQKFSMCKMATEIALRYISRWIPDQVRDDKRKSVRFNLPNRFCHAELDSASILEKWNPEPFKLTITSEISAITMPNGNQHKIGFGSSAAAVVATIKAIFAFYEQDITNEQIFKIAVIAHYEAQGNCGSGFDIAAATYGTTLVYKRFDPTWLEKQIENVITQAVPSCTSLRNIVTQPWPDLKITPIKLPENLIVLVGFSGKSANTSALINAMNDYKKREAKTYQCLISEINNIVTSLEYSLYAGRSLPPLPEKNGSPLFNCINQNRTILAELAQKSGIDLEPDQLTNLISIAQKHGAAAKFSGAGGGDCGIALCTDQAIAEKIKRDWQAAGILVIDIHTL